MTDVARWFPLLLAFTGIMYLVFGYMMWKMGGKAFTGLAWATYFQANLFFLVAYMRGE